MTIKKRPTLTPALYRLEIEERKTLKIAADILESINNEGFDIDDNDFDPGLNGAADVLRHILKRDNELIIPDDLGYKIL